MWNHRLRLTVLLTLVVSIGLALVFVLVAIIVREQSLKRRFGELDATVANVSVDWSRTSSLEDEKEDFPGVGITVFSDSGAVVASTTRRRPYLLLGEKKVGDTLLFGMENGRFTLVGSTSWTETDSGLRQLELVLALLWAPLVLAVAALSWYGGGLVLRPVRELISSAEELSGTSDHRSLETTDTAEFASLTLSLNRLLSKIRQSGVLQEQFASDAAHELRSPLALLRIRIETTLIKDRTQSEYREALEAMLTRVDQLTSIVETLLLSTRNLESQSETIDFGKTVAELVDDWLEPNDLSKRFSVSATSCRVAIPREEVGIVMRNLLSNAVRYSPPDIRIEVSVAVRQATARLEVRDYGSGIAPSEMAAVFERLHRSDESRNRDEGGVGIGLAVVKRLVETRGGTVGFVPVDKGALVRVELPIA